MNKYNNKCNKTYKYKYFNGVFKIILIGRCKILKLSFEIVLLYISFV